MEKTPEKDEDERDEDERDEDERDEDERDEDDAEGGSDPDDADDDSKDDDSKDDDSKDDDSDEDDESDEDGSDSDSDDSDDDEDEDDDEDDEDEDDEDEDDEDEDDDDEDDDDDDAKPKAAAPGRRPSAKVAPARDARPSGGERSGLAAVPTTVWLAAGAALVVGAGAGWFGHNAYAKSAGSSIDAAPLSSADLAAGPCKAWEKQICDSAGPVSATCRQAQGASELLSPATCENALKDVPDVLAKVAKEREKCATLVSKLCTDLGKETNTCKMVESRTSSFPPKRCEDMLGQYDKVLAELKKMEEQGGMPGGVPGGMPGGMPGGVPGGMRGMPPGHPPAVSPEAPPGGPAPAPGAPDPHEGHQH